MNSIKRKHTLIPIVLLSLALMLCFTAFISCSKNYPVNLITPKPEETPAETTDPEETSVETTDPEETPAETIDPEETPVETTDPEETPAETTEPEETPRQLIHKTQDLQIPENPDEVYTAEDARIERYLGCHDDVLYFLGSSPYEPDNPNSILSKYVILSAPRTAQGGTLGLLADLGPAIECTALSMHNGKAILDVRTGVSSILSEGGGLISVDTEGGIQVLKEYGDKMPGVSMYGDRILCVTMPQPGETEQTVESYDIASGTWTGLLSLPLSCTVTDNGVRVYTGTMLRRLGGVSNDGFWYALTTCTASSEGDAVAGYELRYYDAKSGESSHVMDLHEEIAALTGDSAAGYCVAENREYIVYRSEKGAQTVTMPVRERLLTPIRSIEDGRWLHNAVVFDWANGELIDYNASPKNEYAEVFFLNDTPDTILLLLTAKPTEGAAGDAREQRIIVLPTNG